MSMTRVLLTRGVVQPGLFRVTGNSEGKGNEANASSECCLFDDMHLSSQTLNLYSRRLLATAMPAFRGEEVRKNL